MLLYGEEVVPTLPVQPEPLKKLKARFPKCLERLWIASYSMKDRPGLHREYVFDFEDGVRLLISREKYPDGLIATHVSASWEDVRYKNLEETTKDIQRRFNELGGKGQLRLLGLSQSIREDGRISGIPHWIVDVSLN